MDEVLRRYTLIGIIFSAFLSCNVKGDRRQNGFFYYDEDAGSAGSPAAASNQFDLSDVGSSFNRNPGNPPSQPSWQSQQNANSPPDSPSASLFDTGYVSSFKRGKQNQPSQPEWQSQQNAYSPPAPPNQFDQGQVGSSFNRGGGPSSNNRGTFHVPSPPSPPSWQSQPQNQYSPPAAPNQLDLGSVGSSFKRGKGSSNSPSSFEIPQPSQPSWSSQKRATAPPAKSDNDWGLPDYTDEQWAEHRKHEQGYVDMNRQRNEDYQKKRAEEERIKEERRKHQESQHRLEAQRREDEARRRAQERGLGGQRRRPELGPPSDERREILIPETEIGNQDSHIRKDHKTNSHKHKHLHHKFSQAEALAAQKDDEDEEESQPSFFKRMYNKIAGSSSFNIAPSMVSLICVSALIVFISLY